MKAAKAAAAVHKKKAKERKASQNKMPAPESTLPEPRIEMYTSVEAYLADVRTWDRENILREVDRKLSAKLRDLAAPSISMGSGMAMILSFQLSHSIWWMILHGICSWGYVIYRAWQGDY